MLGLIHMHIHSIWRLWNTILCVWHWCVSHLELVYSLNDNNTTLWFACRKTPRILVNVQTLLLLADKNGSSMVKTHPHAHPQHMKVVRHHICAWHWCGSRFEWVYSLKDVLKLRLWFAPQTQKTTRILNSKRSTMRAVVVWCGKDLSIYTSTATEGCNTPYMYFILMFEPSWMGL